MSTIQDEYSKDARLKALKEAGITREYLDKIQREALKGYIYVIKCNEYYKIGCSRKSPQKRLESMQTGNPYQLELILTLKVANYPKAEAICHQYYKDYHVRGEWYKLTDELISKLKKAIANA